MKFTSVVCTGWLSDGSAFVSDGKVLNDEARRKLLEFFGDPVATDDIAFLYDLDPDVNGEYPLHRRQRRLAEIVNAGLPAHPCALTFKLLEAPTTWTLLDGRTFVAADNGWLLL